MTVARSFLDELKDAKLPLRVARLRDRMVNEQRYMSIEQALIITDVYRDNPDDAIPLKRAKSLAAALDGLAIAIDPEELIVGNRTAGVRGGVVFPEAGIAWVDRELESLPARAQDAFNVRAGDARAFRERILPFWKDRSLEAAVKTECGGEVDAIAKVVKINQKDHAQGHICPDAEKWLRLGPAGIREEAGKMRKRHPEKAEFYQCVDIVMTGAMGFIARYADLAADMADRVPGHRDSLLRVAGVCRNLARGGGAQSFHEALQSLWFLFVILHMESNASSFSPGRADQYLYPYFQTDIDAGKLDAAQALELVEALWVKFNQIVYMRHASSAAFFAGFPIGFNVAIGGQRPDGSDAVNEISYLFLKAQEHLGLPQPNLSARLHRDSPEEFVRECAKVIGGGGGMPQIFNDESVIPALMRQGIDETDARNYAIVGCVELTTPGNNLGWSDAAMFNLVKALELALNNGRCLMTNERIGPDTGCLRDFRTFADVEKSFAAQIDHFFDRMIACCEKVETLHRRLLPSAFLSGVIDNCLERGIDVTAGGAKYNLSGVQIIQTANIADCLAALKLLVFEEKSVEPGELLEALHNDFSGKEALRRRLLNKAPKYGNDVPWVDEIANRWVAYFSDKLRA